jgi:dephospho-CoA kinase
VVDAFGDAILDRAAGTGPATINRHRLGAIVFAEPGQRARLESILHPLIFAEADRRRAALEAADPGALIVFVAPLLFETGADRRVERTVAVVTDEATQLDRLMARDGLSRDEALGRIRAQLPAAEKQRRAHEYIDGARPPDDVRRQVEAIVNRLTKH